MTNILLVALYVAAGIAASWEARRKGYDDRIWLTAALLLGPITLFAFWFLPNRPLRAGTVVRAIAPITLEDGGRIPSGHVSVVRETRMLDQTMVCRITAPDASPRWVAQEALGRVRNAPRS